MTIISEQQDVLCRAVIATLQSCLHVYLNKVVVVPQLIC